jgi:superkiller protein 3
VSHLQQAVRLNPRDKKAWYNLGTAQNNLGCYRAAIASFDQTLALNPRDHRAYYSQSVALCGLQRYENALQVLEQSLRFKPCSHYIWNQRGTALMELGYYGEAIASFDTSLRYKAHNPNAWYGKARTYAMGEDLEMTLNSLYRTFVLSPYTYRAMAQIDNHFDNVRHYPRFQHLIQGQSQG